MEEWRFVVENDGVALWKSRDGGRMKITDSRCPDRPAYFDLKMRLHCEDGPARILKDGTPEWWYHDTKLDCDNQQDFERLLKLKVYW